MFNSRGNSWRNWNMRLINPCFFGITFVDVCVKFKNVTLLIMKQWNLCSYFIFCILLRVYIWNFFVAYMYNYKTAYQIYRNLYFSRSWMSIRFGEYCLNGTILCLCSIVHLHSSFLQCLCSQSFWHVIVVTLNKRTW